MIVDQGLARWATDVEKAYLAAAADADSWRSTAAALGVHHDTVRQALARLTARASLQGYAPEHDMERTVPDAYTIRRRSQYFLEGRLHSEWVISSPEDQRRFDLIKAGLEAAAEELPKAEPVALATLTNKLLCSAYVVTDYHLGMLVRRNVSGTGDWNIEIAEDTLYRCFEYLIQRSPDAAVGVLVQLGDLLHTDNLQAMTPSGAHPLDAADTYEQIVKAAVRVLRRVVAMMLTKHDQVHIVMAEGNHDIAGSVWLRVIFAALYENDPRVTVDTSEVPFYAYQHGKTMLAFHHGHLKKKEQLPLLMASMKPEMWGATTKRFVHTGHFHHEQQVSEFNGMKVIQHPTLAPNDSYSTRHGYVSQQQASCITYHAEFGKVGETVFCPEMLLAA